MSVPTNGEQTDFRERSSRKTVSYEERIMSKDKYPSTFWPQMEAIVSIILQIFFTSTPKEILESVGMWLHSHFLAGCVAV